VKIPNTGSSPLVIISTSFSNCKGCTYRDNKTGVGMLDAEMISHPQFEFSFRSAKVAVPIMQVVYNFHPLAVNVSRLRSHFF
jgi:hypothetical protein